MRYIILCGGTYEKWKTPKQLCKVKGETIVERTIRLLRENGVDDIAISSHNPAFEKFGVPVLKHDNFFVATAGKPEGFWVNAFYPSDDPVCYLFGDVVFSPAAIKKIVETQTDDIEFFASSAPFSPQYTRPWAEPFAFKVVDTEHFKKAIEETKRNADKFNRDPLAWELWQVIKGTPYNKIDYKNYTAINDYTVDIDDLKDIPKIERHMEMDNVFFFWHINEIGGVETFFYYLAKKYKDRDITIYYKTGDPKQIERMAHFVRVKKWTGERVTCRKAFFNYNTDIIDYFNAEEYIQIIHADYKALGTVPNTHKKITKYIGVSKKACKSFKELTGIDCELCYNPLEIDEPKRALRLISATRLTSEKGRKRMERFAQILDKSNVPYIWTVFSDTKNKINNPHMVFLKPEIDIVPYLAGADYLVQLSDNEGFCYAVAEALSVGTPVIVTPCPVFKEIGVNKKNSFTLDFDFDDVPVDKLFEGLPKFTYKPKKDKYSEILVDGVSTYQEELKTPVKVKTLKAFYDLQRNAMTHKGDIFETNRIRADDLIEFELVEEVKE